ncbi:MAG TPA: MarR family transcriptional regulator [Gammaproteobacteria bacterium]|nr:MarR family transcriptional regulator [Gammaproteobacteria bacterium]
MASTTSPAAAPDDASWAAAIAIAKVSRSLKQAAFPYALTVERLTALHVVHDRGPISISELSSAEGVSTAAMSRTVSALSADGLVRCSGNGDDRRSVLVRSTARGRGALRRGAKQAKRHVENFLESLDPELLGALRDAAVATLALRSTG